jgi:predicted regulator of Ras-like GTPase activity (Roadblock/LC7/MglB family)
VSLPSADAFVLSEALSVPGVVAVALVDQGGTVRATLESESEGFGASGGLIAAALAASGALVDVVGGAHHQTVVEVDGGPVVVTSLPGGAGSFVVRLASLDHLGRLRFELPRLVERFVEAP